MLQWGTCLVSCLYDEIFSYGVASDTRENEAKGGRHVRSRTQEALYTCTCLIAQVLAKQVTISDL